MNAAPMVPFNPDGVLFGFDLDPEAEVHLQNAAAVVASREKSLEELKKARRAAPDQLEVLVALYKFHFYQGNTAKARDLVFQTLIKASFQGGFSRDWSTLTPESADWNKPRGPERIFLYSLKALAFIRLREVDPSGARKILDTLKRLDPNDQVGAAVIGDLLSALEEEPDDG